MLFALQLHDVSFALIGHLPQYIGDMRVVGGPRETTTLLPAGRIFAMTSSLMTAEYARRLAVPPPSQDEPFTTASGGTRPIREEAASASKADTSYLAERASAYGRRRRREG